MALLPQTPHIARWRGVAYPLRFGKVQFHVEAPECIASWTTIVGFVAGMPRYPLLGTVGFLEYFDAIFLGADRVVELFPNQAFQGSMETGD